jgi:hypothetical protein
MSEAGVRLEEARVGNIIGKTGESGTQNEYYAFMLRQEKIKSAQAAGGIISASEATALQSLGDLEKWELKALARLSRLGDNSPELLQYLHITKSSTREEVAKKLAQKQYKKQLVEDALSLKLLSPDEVRQTVQATAAQTRNRVGQQAFGL